MTTKGKPAMEKTFDEDDLKGLEEEIDSAVDRLFVQKKREPEEGVRMEPPILEPSHDMGKKVDAGFPSPPHSEPVSFLEPLPDMEKKIEAGFPFPPHSEPVSFLEPFEKMETHLLELEWEITGENLRKTKEEVGVLRRVSEGKSSITSVLNLMEKVLNHMARNEENISPPMVKFLLDSKETIKLLMKKETGSEINVYKQLAELGIEARFCCLQGINGTKAESPSSSLSEDVTRTEVPAAASKQGEEILGKMNLFSEKMDEMFKKLSQHLSKVERGFSQSSEKLLEPKALPINVTVFKVDKKFFGVESNKVFKLFRVPNTFHEKYSNQEKIRLKDFEVKLIDLKKIFCIQGGDRRGETNILTVREDGQYKGLIVDQVLKKLSAPAEIGREYGDYFLGMIRWTYQDHSVEIPILDLKKF